MNYITNNRLFTDSPLLGYGAVAAVAISLYTNYSVWLSIIVVLILIILIYFYRNPPIPIQAHSEVDVVAPSYGTVSRILRDLVANTVTLGIFLSPLDIHQQYYPVDGTITNIVYDATGQFALAFDMDKSRNNEKKIHTISTPRGDVKVTQIAGFLVRSIVSDDIVGQSVKAGTRFGMIKFGSRVDIELPQLDKLTLNVEVGSVLEGGSQIIASYSNV